MPHFPGRAGMASSGDDSKRRVRRRGAGRDFASESVRTVTIPRPQEGHPMARPGVIRTRSSATDPIAIARGLLEQAGGDTKRAVAFFADAKLPFDRIAEAIAGTFEGPTFGCTSSGEVFGEHGLCDGSVVAACFDADEFDIRAALLEDVKSIDAGKAVDITGPLLKPTNGRRAHTFGLLLIDGLSVAEEQVTAALSQALGRTPLVGGSASDALAFEHTFVACNGRVAEDAAVLAVVHTDRPIQTVHSHHFQASEDRLVITGADTANRVVTEVNGLPAAEGYALAVGIEQPTLGPHVFAAHPVLLSIGGQYYVRSILRVNDDGSMTFYCAIDEGLVLRIAQANDMAEALAKQFDELESDLGDVDCVIAFDCVLRRLEATDTGKRDQLREVLSRLPVVGFSTYGEQFGGLHLNQTITGIAIGRAA